MLTRSLLLTFVAAALALPLALVWGQTASQFESAGEITDRSLDRLIGHAIIMSFDLSPDGKFVSVLAIEGPKLGPLWILTIDISTNRIVKSRTLGAAVWPTSDFLHQIRYSSDQRYLVVQDLQQIAVLDSESLDTLHTIAPPLTANRQMPLFITGASNSDIFLCAFGSEQRANHGLQPTPVQVEIVDVSSGTLLGAWESEDVPQSISPDGNLVLVSAWGRNKRSVVPLAVLDKNGAKVSDLNDPFSFTKAASQSKPVGRVLGRFVDNQQVVAIPDQHIDKKGHHSGASIEFLTVTGHASPQSLTPEKFSSTGRLVVSGDGRTILVSSFYLPPRVLANPHGHRSGGEGRLFVLGRDSKLHVVSAEPIDSFAQEAQVSSNGSVIALREYNRAIKILRRRNR